MQGSSKEFVTKVDANDVSFEIWKNNQCMIFLSILTVKLPEKKVKQIIYYLIDLSVIIVWILYMNLSCKKVSTARVVNQKNFGSCQDFSQKL